MKLYRRVRIFCMLVFHPAALHRTIEVKRLVHDAWETAKKVVPHDSRRIAFFTK